jgi:G3E family GTPase
MSSGVADPGPIIASLWVDEEMDTCLRLDGVVAVVDAKHIGTLLADPGVYSDVAKQIAYADRVLINKIDITSEEEVRIYQDRVTRQSDPELVVSCFIKLSSLLI